MVDFYNTFPIFNFFYIIALFKDGLPKKIKYLIKKPYNIFRDISKRNQILYLQNNNKFLLFFYILYYIICVVFSIRLENNRSSILLFVNIFF